jgi:hypothetical protein
MKGNRPNPQRRFETVSLFAVLLTLGGLTFAAYRISTVPTAVSIGTSQMLADVSPKLPKIKARNAPSDLTAAAGVKADLRRDVQQLDDVALSPRGVMVPVWVADVENAATFYNLSSFQKGEDYIFPGGQ